MKKQNIKTGLLIAGVLALAVIASCSLTSCSKKGGENPVAGNDIPGLPPDPGEEGKKTLEGINSNNDKWGLRDDIERFIAIEHKDAPIENREVLSQYAKIVQDSIRDSKDKEKSREHAQELSKNIDCLVYIFGSVDEVIKFRNNLSQNILNTDERKNAFEKEAESHLGGQVWFSTPDSELASVCKFNQSKTSTSK